MKKGTLITSLIKLFLGGVFFVLPSAAKCQDIHFTQFEVGTALLNPAMTGMYNGTVRFSAIARNQWATVPVNYNSAKISVEYNFHTFKNKDKVAAGISFYYDRAGDSRYSTAYPDLSMAYAKALGRKKNQYLSLGFNVAMISRQIDYSLLKFDAQYNGEFYDPTALSFESTGKSTKNVFDIGVGIAYNFVFQKKYSLEAGFTIQHLNQPNYSFKDDKTVTLNSRYTASITSTFALTNNFAVSPQLLFQQQDTKQEFLVGLLLRNKILPQKKKDISIYYGPYYRLNDAIAAVAGVKWEQWNIGFSYDVNTSGFRAATRSYGAVELSIQYVYARLLKYKDTKQICPIF